LSVFYTKEELELKEEIEHFAVEYVAPKVEDIEKTKDYNIIRNILKELGKRGFLGVLHPKEYGGSEFGVIGDTIIAEALSYHNFALDLSRLASVHLCGMPLNRFGTPEQKEKYLTPLIKGEKIGCIGITEPDVGSDAAGMKTRAIREGDYYIINGEKRFITNGSQADYICLFAITTPLPFARPKTGMTAFIVEKGMKGFTVEKDFELMGLNGTRISHLRFENVAVPVENRLADENFGFKVLMDELNSERVAIAGQGVGVANAAFETALKYSTERIQFDREIRGFEGVSFIIAQMATRIEAARALTIQAARTIDRVSNIKATKIASMAKYYACYSANWIATEGIQLMGGIGYTKEHPMERFARDAPLLEIGGGTRNVMLYLIQREAYRERGF